MERGRRHHHVTFKRQGRRRKGGYKYEVKADFNPLPLLLISRAQFRSTREQVGV